MATDSKCVRCPYCLSQHDSSIVLARTGLIHYDKVNSKEVTCKKCGKKFKCETEVILRYKTHKIISLDKKEVQ